MADTRPKLAVRVLAAFAPRPHLVALFRPERSRLGPVDGLRAIAILWVIAFHGGVYSIGVLPPAEYVRLLLSPWMLPSWRGAFGVDLFFVLSGFLIAGMLVREREETGKVRLGLFYLRRLMRLFPALAVSLAGYLWLVPQTGEMAWAVLLYVGNFVPIARACMPWTWSLAIEEQFYLVAPWLLAATARARPSARVPIVVALAAILATLGAVIAHQKGYFPFDVEIVPNRPAERWNAAFDDLYTKPWMRAGPLLAGICAAFVYRSETAMARLARARWGAPVGLVAAIALACVAMHWPWWSASSRVVGLVYIGVFRTVFGAAVAYLLLFVLSEHPLGKKLGRALAWRGLYPVAQLSYAAYLVNPVVALVVRAKLGPAAFDGRLGMPSLFVIDLAITLAVALVIHVLVEKPFMQLRPSAKTAKA